LTTALSKIANSASHKSNWPMFLSAVC